MPKFTYKNLLGFLFISASLALFFVYIAQYFFGLQPCNLCLYQRIPFFAVVILTILSLGFLRVAKWQKLSVYFCIFLILANAVIAFYHFGVEKKIFSGLSSCSSTLNHQNSLQDLEQSLVNAKVIRCDQPDFLFLGFSMAGWNMLYCLFLAIFSFFILKKSK